MSKQLGAMRRFFFSVDIGTSDVSYWPNFVKVATGSYYIDLARAKSKALDNIYSFFK